MALHYAWNPSRQALRRRAELSASSLRCWGDRVVPLRMKWVGLDVEGGHLSVCHLDAFVIGPGVDFTFDREAGRGGGGRDQFDNRRAAGQRAPAPVLRDVAKEPV